MEESIRCRCEENAAMWSCVGYVVAVPQNGVLTRLCLVNQAVSNRSREMEPAC